MNRSVGITFSPVELQGEMPHFKVQGKAGNAQPDQKTSPTHRKIKRSELSINSMEASRLDGRSQPDQGRSPD